MTNISDSSKATGATEESATQPPRKAWAAPVVIVSSVARNTLAKASYFGFESHSPGSLSIS